MLLNLHSHLEGSVRPSTAGQLAETLGIPAPPHGWKTAMTMASPANLTVFLRHVASVYPLLGTRDALHRVAREAVEDADADGQDYVEIRFGPGTHVRPDLTLSQVVNAVDQGIREGAAHTGMPAGLILCMLRHHSQDMNAAVAQAACSLAGSAVVALDLAGDERLFPDLEPFAPMFAAASAAGLGITVHAGEAAPGRAVQDAVQLFGTRRIGHGSRLAEDPALLTWARQEEVCIEVCLSSNILTGAAKSLRDHPITAFLNSGCRVVLGDDDPITTGMRASAELGLLRSQLNLTAAHLQQISDTSIDIAFCTPHTKAELRDGPKGRAVPTASHPRPATDR